ncbi:MAG: endonuclease protein [Hyphomicrobiales bacterium]|nr:endonuclease protein [Hyphomicrobiales bacterium]
MWTLLRGLRPLGFHFRRQVPIGRYYADFVCHQASLVIEIDGDTHGSDAAMQYDAERDNFIKNEGYDIVRILNHDVMENLDGVIGLIEAELAGRLRTPTHDPSPQGGGKRRSREVVKP